MGLPRLCEAGLAHGQGAFPVHDIVLAELQVSFARVKLAFARCQETLVGCGGMRTCPNGFLPGLRHRRGKCPHKSHRD